MTTDLVDAPDFRVSIEPNDKNGLRAPSQIMPDKPVTIRRARIGETIGRIGADDIRRLNLALAFVMGLADEALPVVRPSGGRARNWTALDD